MSKFPLNQAHFFLLGLECLTLVSDLVLYSRLFSGCPWHRRWGSAFEILEGKSIVMHLSILFQVIFVWLFIGVALIAKISDLTTIILLFIITLHTLSYRTQLPIGRLWGVLLLRVAGKRVLGGHTEGAALLRRRVTTSWALLGQSLSDWERMLDKLAREGGHLTFFSQARIFINHGRVVLLFGQTWECLGLLISTLGTIS